MWYNDGYLPVTASQKREKINGETVITGRYRYATAGSAYSTDHVRLFIDGTNGSDDNTGLDPANALKTLDKITEMIELGRSDIRLYFITGGTYEWNCNAFDNVALHLDNMAGYNTRTYDPTSTDVSDWVVIKFNNPITHDYYRDTDNANSVVFYNSHININQNGWQFPIQFELANTTPGQPKLYFEGCNCNFGSDEVADGWGAPVVFNGVHTDFYDCYVLARGSSRTNRTRFVGTVGVYASKARFFCCEFIYNNSHAKQVDCIVKADRESDVEFVGNIALGRFDSSPDTSLTTIVKGLRSKIHFEPTDSPTSANNGIVWISNEIPRVAGFTHTFTNFAECDAGLEYIANKLAYTPVNDGWIGGHCSHGVYVYGGAISATGITDNDSYSISQINSDLGEKTQIRFIEQSVTTNSYGNGNLDISPAYHVVSVNGVNTGWVFCSPFYHDNRWQVYLFNRDGRITDETHTIRVYYYI